MAYTDIDKSDEYFNTLIYTGDGTDDRSITGLGFQPDFCWFKDRTGANSHNLFDSVRGVNLPLISNSTSAELTGFDLFNSFDSDGFTISGATADNTNYNGSQFVSWSWKAGGTGVSNTNGSITSTVSANTTSGFSIVTYTSTTGTVGHGLGVAPKVIIMKARNVADQWTMGHASLPSWTYGLGLNYSSGQDSNATFWNSTAPTSTVFSQGSWDNGYNKVAYCFAEKKGFSKFGSYTGNGSTDGTFVYTGFKPAFVMVKRTNSTGSWRMWDNKREGYNGDNAFLYANLSNAEEADGGVIDLLSNGFKFRNTSGDNNASGSTYIYMAFAENPFVTSTGIPACAR